MQTELVCSDLLYTCNEVQSQKSTFTCNEVHLSCTFENVTKYRYFVIFFLALLFSAIVGRCRLHVMAPGSNSANKNAIKPIEMPGL